MDKNILEKNNKIYDLSTKIEDIWVRMEFVKTCFGSTRIQIHIYTIVNDHIAYFFNRTIALNSGKLTLIALDRAIEEMKELTNSPTKENS